LIQSIYRDFSGVLARGGTWRELLNDYLNPNRSFFDSYLSFQTQGEMDWDRFVKEFRDLWHGPADDTPRELPGAAQRLLGRIDGYDVDASVQRGYRQALQLLRPRTEMDLYVCVGLELSNAFMVMVEEKPAVGVALEAYGRLFGTTFVSFDDLLHVIPHELCHAVRASDTDSPLRCFFQGEDPARAMKQILMHEMVIEEGLACWTGAAAAPELPLSQTLFYSPEDFRWCEENEGRLRDEFEVCKDLPLGNEGFTRWFGIGPENGNLPPRAGYFLGYRLMERYFRKNPEVDTTKAVRQPVEAFYL
jgi:hypothetical protein